MLWRLCFDALFSVSINIWFKWFDSNLKLTCKPIENWKYFLLIWKKAIKSIWNGQCELNVNFLILQKLTYHKKYGQITSGFLIMRITIWFYVCLNVFKRTIESIDFTHLMLLYFVFKMHNWNTNNNTTWTCTTWGHIEYQTNSWWSW